MAMLELSWLSGDNMSVVPVKAALTQPHFPMNSDNFVDCVLRDAGFEQERLVEGFDNQPQAFFMQNVLPQARGFTSVHYSQVVVQSTYPTYMDKILQLRDSSGSVALLSPAGGKNFIYTSTTSSWVSFDFGFPHSGNVTIAYLKGVTYVCYEGLGVYVYDFTAATFTAVTLAGGIVFTDIIGIAAAGVYLVLYTKEYIAYSSPLDPLDFTVALGAGGQSQILANKGTITTVLGTNNGLVVYTTVNAIWAQLTNNANFPFAFREIPNSAGVSDSEHVTYDSTNDEHIAWTTSGFMRVSAQRAELEWEELSDMIADGKYPANGGYLNFFMPSMNSFDSLSVKVSTIGARYIVVSLKNSDPSVYEYQLAYVYDRGLKRWGRIDIPHIDVFEYRDPEFTRQLVYDDLTAMYDSYTQTYDELGIQISGSAARFGTTFGVVGKLGAVFTALPSDYNEVEMLESDSGAALPFLILGKYKLIRSQGVIFQQLRADVMHNATMITVAHDANGKPVKMKQLTESSRDVTWSGRNAGTAVSIVIAGRFSLTSLQMMFEPSGSGLPVALQDSLRIPGNVVTVNGDYVIDGGGYVVS